MTIEQYYAILDKAKEEFFETTNAALLKANLIIEPAQKEYWDSIEPRIAKYEEIVNPAEAEYNAILIEAQHKYDAIASAALNNYQNSIKNNP